jgi:hypothetical protein
MADTDVDAVRKQKKAEYDKQYRLKRKVLLQQQASKDIYMIRYFHPERWKVYVYFFIVAILILSEEFVVDLERKLRWRNPKLSCL